MKDLTPISEDALKSQGECLSSSRKKDGITPTLEEHPFMVITREYNSAAQGSDDAETRELVDLGMTTVQDVLVKMTSLFSEASEPRTEDRSTLKFIDISFLNGLDPKTGFPREWPDAIEHVFVAHGTQIKAGDVESAEDGLLRISSYYLNTFAAKPRSDFWHQQNDY